MFKGFLFDLDGLLADTESISWHIYEKMLAPFGKTMTKDHYSRNYSGKTEVANINQLIKEYGLPYSFDQAKEIERKIEEDLIEQGVKLKPGAPEIIKFLYSHGYKIALASSSRRSRAEKILKPHGIWDLFASYTLAEDITHPKPHGEVFEKAAQTLNLAPKECLVLEDSEAGIQAAKNAGCSVVCVPDLKTPRSEFLDLCVSVFPDLYEVKKEIESSYL